VLPPGLSMRIAYRMLMESDGFIHKGTRRRPKFVAYIPEAEEDELTKMINSATSPKARGKPKVADDLWAPDIEEEVEGEEKEDDEELQAYLKEHRPKESPDCDAHVHLPPDPPNPALMARARAQAAKEAAREAPAIGASLVAPGDAKLIKALENPKKIQNYSCGNGLDYLARKRDGLDSQTAMLWVFTHHNNTNYAQESD